MLGIPKVRFVCGVMVEYMSEMMQAIRKSIKNGDTVLSKRQEKEEEVDDIFKQLKERHGQKI